jgi:2-hydroxychromene-2-carboxylate isomerase
VDTLRGPCLHWGVPTFVFENEPFFGQDRIDLLIWRMQDKGLTRRKF